MPARREPWPDLVEKALFESDPALRRQRVKEARQGIADRLQQLDVEREMLEEATRQLNSLN